MTETAAEAWDVFLKVVSQDKGRPTDGLLVIEAATAYAAAKVREALANTLTLNYVGPDDSIAMLEALAKRYGNAGVSPANFDLEVFTDGDGFGYTIGMDERTRDEALAVLESVPDEREGEEG